MAIGHRGTGTAVFGQNSITPGIHASTVAGDMMLLLIGGKPYNTGYSLPGDWEPMFVTRPSDGTTAAGVDVGSMFVDFWYKQHDGSETDPTITEGSPTFDVVGALIMSFSKASNEVWTETGAATGGGDATAGTGFSVTGGAVISVAAGDVCVSLAAFRSDAATPCSSHLVATLTGATFTNTHDPATDPESTTGGDMGMCINRATLTGSGSAAPVMTATLAAAHTGAAAFTRLRVSPSRGYPLRRRNNILQRR